MKDRLSSAMNPMSEAEAASMSFGPRGVTRPAREGSVESGTKSHLYFLVPVLRPMVLMVVLTIWAWALAAVPLQAAGREYDEPDVILAIKEKAFQVVKGDALAEDSPHPGLSLSPGEDIILELRNEDKLPHEFVSPVFTLVEFQFWGKATLVYTYTATGIRIEPGEKVALRFELPKGFSGKHFKFWCNVHGKLHNDTLQGEIFVVKSKGTSH